MPQTELDPPPPSRRAHSRHEGRAASRFPVRITLLALAVIALWLGVSAIGGPYFGRVSEVSNDDRNTYLPASAEATQVQNRLDEFIPASGPPAIIVVTSKTPFTQETIEQVSAVVQQVTTIEGISGEASPAIPSEDGLALQAFIPLDVDAPVAETVDAIRAQLAAELPQELTAHVTGPAGFSADLVDAFGGIDGILLLVALSAVFVILIIVYRAVLLPFLVLFNSMAALCAALLVVWWLAKWDVLILTGQTQGILFILVVGAATDYALLYTARFREELASAPSRWVATKKAWRASVEPIVASGSTVIAGLLCLLVSDLGSNKSLGPVAAIGIVFSMLAGLTLLPAILLVTGRVAYWPRNPAQAHHDAAAPKKESLYTRVGNWITPRPRAVWAVSFILLAVGAGFMTQLKADGVAQSELVLSASDARDGQDALAKHFPGSSGTPVYVITPSDGVAQVAETLQADERVDLVTITSQSSPSGSVPLEPQMPDEAIAALEPTTSGGDVLLQATLDATPDSAEALETVHQLRSTLGDQAMIGGSTATTLDTNDAATRDRSVIIPIVLVVILLILMGLLRSVVAPLLLVATTVLSFATAMGVSALVFNHLLHFPGADPVVPLYGFVFLVALGIDYNIFLMTRVREESLAHGTEEGIRRGLSATGGVITSAGIVLAATFAALAVIPILFLAQLAFIVAFGVLLDTFLVRTLLVPALAMDLGKKIWWPSKLAA